MADVILTFDRNPRNVPGAVLVDAVEMTLRDDGALDETGSRELRVSSSGGSYYLGFRVAPEHPATDAQKRAMAPLLIGLNRPEGVAGVGAQIRGWLGLTVEDAQALAGDTRRLAIHIPG